MTTAAGREVTAGAGDIWPICKKGHILRNT